MKHVELLARLESFSIDEPGIDFTFTQRLARENGWTRGFAERVVQEYKRFAFLAVAAGHPVTPSDEIDEAWHLHLLYTQSYWKKFCGEVLQRPLHHNPTKGGVKESEKFRDWYAQTLASYEKFFAHKPPTDIWPPVEKRFAHHEHRRVDVLRHWVIPKPRWTPFARTAASGLVAITLLAGCHQTLGTAIPLLDWTGSQFLTFYLIAAPLMFLAALWWQTQLLQPDGNVRPGDLPNDVYSIAALSGGPVQVVNAAVVSLVEQGALKVVQTDKITLVPTGKPAATAHPFEKRLREGLSAEGEEMKNVRARCSELVEPLITELQEKRWVVRDADVPRIQFMPFVLAVIVPLFSILKIFIGLHRNRPVGFLVILVILTGIIAGVVFLRRPKRTLLGDKILHAVESAYRSESRKGSLSAAAPAFVPLAVALFGLTALSGTAHESLRKQLTPPAPPSSSGCGSSCGGGGGDGGGGGSCGGGGCGGCGGGGD